MFCLTDLDEYIDYIDEKLREYARIFNYQKNDFDTQTLNRSYITYERTLSSYANNEITNKLKKDGYSVLLSVNEFPIDFNNNLSTTVFGDLIDEVNIKKEIKQWNYCVVDGYFKIDQLLCEEVSHVFIEYKLQNKFVYLDLALDYLKYKAYSYINNSNLYFVYVIINKDENYPSIKKGKYPFYIFLDDKISDLSDKIGESGIYIYIPSSNDNKALSSSKLNDIIDKIGRVSLFSRKTLRAFEIVNESIPSNKRVFVDNMSIFNKRVVKSHTLRNNGKFINELWTESNRSGLFDDIKKYFSKCSSSLDEQNDQIIKEGSQYKEMLLNQINIKEQKQALENGVNGGNTTSLFIVAFLDYFKDKYKINSCKPSYGHKNIGKGNNKMEHKWETTANKFKEKLRLHYDQQNSDFNIKKLAYSLLFYLHNTFSIIYDFDSGGEITGFTEVFKYYELLDEFQLSLTNAMRLLKYKGEKLNVEEYIENENSNQLTNLLKFVGHIIKSV